MKLKDIINPLFWARSFFGALRFVAQFCVSAVKNFWTGLTLVGHSIVDYLKKLESSIKAGMEKAKVSLNEIHTRQKAEAARLAEAAGLAAAEVARLAAAEAARLAEERAQAPREIHALARACNQNNDAADEISLLLANVGWEQDISFLRARDANNDTPLMWAAYHGNPEVVLAILNACTSDQKLTLLTDVNYQGNKALIEMVSGLRSVRGANRIVSIPMLDAIFFNITPEQRTQICGATLISRIQDFYRAQPANAEAARLLQYFVEIGAIPEGWAEAQARLAEAAEAVRLAAEVARLAAAEAARLAEERAQAPRQIHALARACNQNNDAADEISLLLANVGWEQDISFLRARDASDDTPLMWAAYHGNPEVVLAILNACTPDQKLTLLTDVNQTGNTALMEMVYGLRARHKRLSIPMLDAIFSNITHEQCTQICGATLISRIQDFYRAQPANAEAARLLQYFVAIGAIPEGWAEAQARLAEAARLAAPVAPIIVPRAPVQQPEAVFNGFQSYAVESVDQTVSESSQRLRLRYLARNNVVHILTSFVNWMDSIPANHVDADIARWVQPARGAASDILNRIKDYTDPRNVNGLNIVEALACVWKGINDPNALRATTDQVLSPAEINERRKRLLQHLYECRRGYNLDDIGQDRGGLDHSICAHGHFNKIISTLDKEHDLVKIVSVTKQSFSAKAQVCLYEAFSELSEEDLASVDQEDRAWAYNDSVSEAVWDILKPKVIEKLRAEFDEHRQFFKNGRGENDYDETFDAIVDSLEDMQNKRQDFGGAAAPRP